MTREIIQKWLDEEGRMSSWLAEQLGESKQTVSNFMREKNPRTIPSRLIDPITEIINKHKPHNIVPLNQISLMPSAPQREAWENAGLARGGEGTDFLYERLDTLAAAINNATLSPKEELKVAQDETEYNNPEKS